MSAPRAADHMEVIASDEGFVVHDAAENTVHYLNHTAAIVFSLCDGTREVEEIAGMIQGQFDLSSPPLEDVQTTIEQLRENGLVL